MISGVNGFSSVTMTDDWEHALAAGNGRQGVLSYGGPAALRFTLSHERLFLPLHERLDAPHTAAVLPRLRALLAAGRHQEAAEAAQRCAVAGHPGYARTRDSDRFIGAATITVEPPRGGDARGYRRTVDFRTGVATQAWRAGDAEVRAEAFVSRADDVVAVRLPAACGAPRLAPVDGDPPHPVEFTGHAGAAWLGLRARFCYAAGWPGALPGFAVLCRVARTGDDLLLLARTLPGAVDLDAAVAALAALPADWAALLARHADRHADLFARTALRLTPRDLAALPRAPAPLPRDLAVEPGDRPGMTDIDTSTTARSRGKGGGGEGEGAGGAGSEELLAGGATPELVETLFAAGRHAIISASGELPPNLQGVWSGTWRPAWSGDYTLDGNLQSAVAALLGTGTPELMLPVFDLLDRFADDFAHNARRLYGAGGILLPPHCASHGRHNHFNPTWCLTFWTAGAAWLARLYHDYWLHTGDRDFLAGRAWPFLVAAADFYADFVTVEAGVARFSPSYSPENAPATTGSQACVDATMDVAAVRDLLRNLLAAAAELGRPVDPRWPALLAALPPYRIAPTGELAEWLPAGLADHHAHRHASHLFPLWYEPDPDLVGDPALRRAAVEAVRRRLAWWLTDGSDEPGASGASGASEPVPDEMAFGLVQLGLAAAHLGLAEEAYAAVCRLARYWRPNLISTHNVGALFNTDICGGLPAVVLAMLATSTSTTRLAGPVARCRVELLPALPAAWPSGELAGAALRGPVRLERLSWAPGGVEAVLVPGFDGGLELGLPAGTALAEVTGAALSGGGRLRVAAGRAVWMRALPLPR